MALPQDGVRLPMRRHEAAAGAARRVALRAYIMMRLMTPMPYTPMRSSAIDSRSAARAQRHGKDAYDPQRL